MTSEHMLERRTMYNYEYKPCLIEELEKETKQLNIGELGSFLKEHVPQLEERLSGKISISFNDLRNKHPDFNINSRNPGWAASTIKVPVMIGVMRAIDRGALKIDDTIEVNHKHTLEEGDFISGIRQGEKIRVGQLIYEMIVYSDNEATNMLANRVGLEYINYTAKTLGTKRTMISHLLAYNVPRILTKWNRDGSNLTTAKDMTVLLSSIYDGRAASKAGCDFMIKMLELSSMKPLASYLPIEVPVANKVGAIYDHKAGEDFHDVGVINNEFALSVMCNRVKHKWIAQKCTPTAEMKNLYCLVALDEATSERFDYLFDDEMEYTYYIHDEDSLRPSEVISSISKITYDLYQKSKR